ncbi:MAG TPA: hypothetical protein VGN88_11950, partial [Phycisphaerae bacterium]
WLFSAQKWPKTAFPNPKTHEIPAKTHFPPIPRPLKNTLKIFITPASPEIYDFTMTRAPILLPEITAPAKRSI